MPRVTQPTATSLTVLAVLVAGFAFAAPTALSNHSQPATPAPIVFDHIGGNEYWLEARITSAAHIQMANVRHESGQFQDFVRSDWDEDVYIIGTHIPPGERVQFQVMLEGGNQWVNSCLFTHPAGVEQCNNSESGPFTVAFRNPSGNEWWQQIYVDSNRPLLAVYVDLYGIQGGMDNWLQKRSWGAYAGSYYAPKGTIAQFKAYAGDEGAASACYKWPEIVVTACPPRDDVVDASDTTFDHKTGNEWWVETVVGPFEPTRVMAQDEGGPWVELTKRSWGAWAGSFHVEPGHKVHFRALVQDAWYESCWFTHPAGLAPDGGQTCRSTRV